MSKIKTYNFHGYTVQGNGTVLGKNGKPLSQHLRRRRGGGNDLRVTLQINGKGKHFTLSRLMADCFLGSVYGLEVNHKDRNPLNCTLSNLEIVTRSENQKHWRKNEKSK